MNYRTQRLNGDMQNQIALIIRDKLKDPRVSEMVSVTQVDIAKDLKTAKVYISIYGDKDKCDITFDALKNSAGFIKKELSSVFRDLRTVPTLSFVLDTSFEYSNKINTMLDELKKKETQKD